MVLPLEKLARMGWVVRRTVGSLSLDAIVRYLASAPTGFVRLNAGFRAVESAEHSFIDVQCRRYLEQISREVTAFRPEYSMEALDTESKAVLNSLEFGYRNFDPEFEVPVPGLLGVIGFDFDAARATFDDVAKLNLEIAGLLPLVSGDDLGLEYFERPLTVIAPLRARHSTKGLEVSSKDAFNALELGSRSFDLESEISKYRAQVKGPLPLYLAPATSDVFAELQREVAELRALSADQALRIAVLEAASGVRDRDTARGDEDSRAPLRSGSVDDMLSPFYVTDEDAERRFSEDPDMLDGYAFGVRIGVTRQAVQQKRQRGEVIGLRQSGRKFWYPVAQIDANGRILTGVAEVLTAFGNDAWRAHEFLTSPQVGLDGVTGREALLAGRMIDVLTTIEGIREGGFG